MFVLQDHALRTLIGLRGPSPYVSMVRARWRGSRSKPPLPSACSMARSSALVYRHRCMRIPTPPSVRAHVMANTGTFHIRVA